MSCVLSISNFHVKKQDKRKQKNKQKTNKRQVSKNKLWSVR